jgi:hypothetical protein
MAYYFIQIPCVQEGTSNKKQAMGTKPMEKEMRKKERIQ